MASATALALLAGGVTACGSGEKAAAPSSSTTPLFSTPPNAFEQQRADGVTALLDALTKALTSGDRAGLDALIDPLATPAFRQSLHRAQDDLRPAPARRAATSVAPTATPSGAAPQSPAPQRSVPRRSPRSGDRPSSSAPAATVPRGSNLVLRTLQYRLAPSAGPERLIGGELGVRLNDAGASDTWVTPITASYALGGAARPGVDEPVIDVPQELAVARYGDDWKLLGDGSLAPDESVDPTQEVRPPELVPWAFGGLLADDVPTAGGTSSILSYPGTDRTVAKVRDQLAPAVAAVTAFWGDAWVRKAVIQVTGTPEQFAGFTRTAPGETNAAAAATVFSRIDGGAKTVIGQRVVLAPAAGQLSVAGIGVVLRHELTHVATRLDTADDAPMWLTEGVAEYVGRRGTKVDFTDVAPELSAQIAAGDVPKALPSDKDFSVDTDAARLAYQSSWSFATFVAQKYGEDKLKRMYLAVAQGGPVAKTDAALAGALGVDRATAVAQWRTWLGKQVR
ncbi:peptidase MA family metallohydrolase [Gordonia sp. FQ]|uniref:peptidase MA family metallohydrolase n=1 Tax=Gordonia sp. FQ TaxID=3446634 RepID=UPI003F87C178